MYDEKKSDAETELYNCLDNLSKIKYQFSTPCYDIKTLKFIDLLQEHNSDDINLIEEYNIAVEKAKDQVQVLNSISDKMKARISSYENKLTIHMSLNELIRYFRNQIEKSTLPFDELKISLKYEIQFLVQNVPELMSKKEYLTSIVDSMCVPKLESLPLFPKRKYPFDPFDPFNIQK